MLRSTLLAAAVLAASAAIAPLPASAQGTTPAQAAAMQPGGRMMINAGLGQRVVRMVMIGDNGGTIDIVYDMPPGATQSQRVLRLENVNGMLQVLYDTTVPSMSLASGGTPRLVQQGSGMYEVVYDRR